jgi:hypothetical protein
MSLLDTASLIVTPNGYKEGKLYSVIPSDGSGDLSVTRATTATRVNSAGLVELVPYNLFTYSEQFDNSAWPKYEASITANNTTAPNGTLTADKVIPSTDNDSHAIERPVSGAAQSFSLYAKAGEYSRIALLFTVHDALARFNLTNGTIISTSGSVTASIEDAGNGWYRCIISTTLTTHNEARIYVLDNSSNFNYTGNGTNGLFIWGAQLVEGSTAKDYQKTETRLNIPRLDYSNGTCPSLLVEPQRTNLLTWSSSFNNWLPAGGSVTANTTTAPDGTMTADTLNGIRYQNPIGVNVWTFSCYAKANGGSGNFWLRVDIPATNETLFDLTNGTYSAPSGYTASIEDVGNGWYRCTMTTPSVNIINAVVVSSNYGTNETFIWGAQFEAGAYPTSYIPTTSASVTRNADVISKTGISSLIGQTEGTFFTEFYYNGIIDNSNARKIISFNDGSSTNLIDAFIGVTGNTITTRVRANDSSLGQINSAVLTQGFYKIAYAYKNSDFVLYVNGVQAGSVSSGTISFTSAVSIAQIGDGEASNDQLGSLIKAAALWKTRLTNDQLTALTTL